MSGKILIKVLVCLKEPANSDEAESLGTLGHEGTRGEHTQEKEGIVVARRKDLCSRAGVKTAKLLQGREEADEFSDLFFLHYLSLTIANHLETLCKPEGIRRDYLNGRDREWYRLCPEGQREMSNLFNL